MSDKPKGRSILAAFGKPTAPRKTRANKPKGFFEAEDLEPAPDDSSFGQSPEGSTFLSVPVHLTGEARFGSTGVTKPGTSTSSTDSARVTSGGPHETLNSPPPSEGAELHNRITRPSARRPSNLEAVRSLIPPAAGPASATVTPSVPDDDQELFHIQKIEGTPIIQQLSEPLRARARVDLPLGQFEISKLQTDVTLEQLESRVDRINHSTEEMNSKLINLSQSVRTLSEKSMDVTQTAEVVVSKLSVMDDWIDGLESTGSGLKMQAIEWMVRLVSLLSALLLFIWRAVGALNPFRKKEKELVVPTAGKPGELDEDDET
jgi:hypothetical protein